MANALSDSGEFYPLENHKKDNLSTESLFQILKPAVLVLVEKGIKVVLVTLGSRGVFLCSKEGSSCFKISVEKTNRSSFSGQLYNAVMRNCPPNCYSGFSGHDRSNRVFAVHLPSLPASVVRLTGAGDCLVGGTLSSICTGLDIMQSVAVGIAVAKAAVEVESNVPSAFSLSAIVGKILSMHLLIVFVAQSNVSLVFDTCQCPIPMRY